MEPTISCDKNVSARVGDLYVKIACVVEHPNVNIDRYAFEIGETGDVIYPGNVTDSFDEVTVQVSWQRSSAFSSASVRACNHQQNHTHARTHAYTHVHTQANANPHTPSIAFRHLPPNSARFSYATEGALFISAQLSSDAVSALRKVRVLI